MTPNEARGLLAAEEAGLFLTPKQRYEAHLHKASGLPEDDRPKPTLDWRQLLMRCTEEGHCLLWNQGVLSTGYPQARIDGRPWMVSRYVYEVLLGKSVKKGNVLVPVCRNKRCIAPACLHQMSYGERLKRAYESGARSSVTEYQARRDRAIRQGMAKLTFEIAEKVRTERMDEPNTAIAAELGVHPKTIYSIKRGESWRRVSPGSTVFALAEAA